MKGGLRRPDRYQAVENIFNGLIRQAMDGLHEHQQR